jgi:hypothetical protein
MAVASDCRCASARKVRDRTSGTQIWMGRSPNRRNRSRCFCTFKREGLDSFAVAKNASDLVTCNLQHPAEPDKGDRITPRVGARRPRLHRRERWQARCAPSKAAKAAEAVRTGRNLFAKRTQFLERSEAGLSANLELAGSRSSTRMAADPAFGLGSRQSRGGENWRRGFARRPLAFLLLGPFTFSCRSHL